jgi:hypothetical protein
MDNIAQDRRHTVTDEEKQLLIGDELTKSSAALVALCWPDNDQAPAIVSDFLAHLLGRATALASSAVLGLIKPVNARLDQIDIQQRTAGERLSGLEGRQNTNTTRIGELHLRLNGRAEQIDKLLDRLTPGGEVDQLTQLLYTLATKVEDLEKQAHGDGNR